MPYQFGQIGVPGASTGGLGDMLKQQQQDSAEEVKRKRQQALQVQQRLGTPGGLSAMLAGTAGFGGGF